MEARTHQPEINAHDLARYIVQSSSSNGSEHDQTAIPPGFRFHPTEEELVGFYLRRMLQGHKLPIHLIPTVDLCSFDPWELPEVAAPARLYEPTDYWYFFVPRSSKFRHGERPNRLTKSGYWKATGTDTRLHAAIGRAQEHHHENDHHIEGHHNHQRHHHQYFSALRKTMVFYEGRAPSGIKTGWILDEYRMDPSSQKNIIHLDQNVDSTICRLRLKRLRRWPAAKSRSGGSNFGGGGSVTPKRQESASTEGEERHHEAVSLHFASISDNSTPSTDLLSEHDFLHSNYSTHGPHVQTLSLHDMDGAPASQDSKNIMRPASTTSAVQIGLSGHEIAGGLHMDSQPPGLGRLKGSNSLFSPVSLDDEFLLNLHSYETHTHINTHSSSQ